MLQRLLALVGSGAAYAQKRPLPAEDRAAVVDARIAEHKAALKLTAEQEKNWAGYEAALRKLAKLRVERYQEQKSANPVELLRQRAEDLTAASAALNSGRRGGTANQQPRRHPEAPVF